MRSVLNRLGAALDAVDKVALVEQELSEVRAVLAGDTRDQCYFFLIRHLSTLFDFSSTVAKQKLAAPISIFKAHDVIFT